MSDLEKLYQPQNWLSGVLKFAQQIWIPIKNSINFNQNQVSNLQNLNTDFYENRRNRNRDFHVSFPWKFMVLHLFLCYLWIFRLKMNQKLITTKRFFSRIRPGYLFAILTSRVYVIRARDNSKSEECLQNFEQCLLL